MVEATKIGFPTMYTSPMWDRPVLRERAKRNFEIRDISVRQVSSKFKPDKGLMRSPYTPDYPKALNPTKLQDKIETAGLETGRLPGAEPDVVEWMIYCAGTNIAIEQRLAEYNRAVMGGPVRSESRSFKSPEGTPVRITSHWFHGYETEGAKGAANDATWPGVKVEDCHFPKRVPGRRFGRRGYDIMKTSRGDYRVPAKTGQFEPGGAKLGAFRDHLSWGSMSGASGYQKRGTVVKWKKLANTPITQTIGHIMDWAGNNAPNLIVAEPPRPKMAATLRTRISSGNDQEVKFRFRDTSDYSNILSERSVAVAEGTSEVETEMTGFPYVTPSVAEVQPETETETKEEEMVVV